MILHFPQQPRPLTLLDADHAAIAAANRFAFAVLRWTSTPPVKPGWYGWRCGTEGPEFVGVGSMELASGTFGPLLVVGFPGKSMPLVEVLAAYPGSMWARINRGGKHESG